MLQRPIWRRKQARYILGLSVLSAIWGSNALLASAQASPGNIAQKQANKSLLPHANKVKSSANLHDVKIDWFMPPGQATSTSQKLPVILIYHGSGGLGDYAAGGSGHGFFAELAKALAANHRACGVVHYMDSTGHKSASSQQMARYFGVWLGAVQNSIKAARQCPFVSPDRVTLMGHSLGAQLALEAAARDKQIHSVVDMAGCFVLPTSKVSAMPPVLVLHGKLDNVVPLSREKALIKVLDRIGSKYEEHIYPRGDHAFNGVAFDDIVQTTDKFLLKY